jgi:hypothetical protein
MHRRMRGSSLHGKVREYNSAWLKRPVVPSRAAANVAEESRI